MKTKTPICDFAQKYAQKGYARFHMPGHKGKEILGYEKLDITEIDGADSLYEAKGIIAESERNAATLFGTDKTLYSTEGSSQCIRAMLYLTKLVALSQNCKPVVVATRNAHKVFALAVSLLDIDVIWIETGADSYLSTKISPKALDEALTKIPYATAVYVTSPDYLGNVADIRGLADVAHRHNSMLIVDNAHGAYLKFVQYSSHPMDKGADVCCDSAHKTLPVLTGGAYLHISHNTPELVKQHCRDAMAMFGSTSPSYLTLQSLDYANGLLLDGYVEKIRSTVTRTAYFMKKFRQSGWKFVKHDEPLKITIDARENGYTGIKLAKLLMNNKVMPEYYDPDYVVLMISAESDYNDFETLQKALTAIPPKKAMIKPTFAVPHKAAMSMKKALKMPSEYVDVADAENRIVASPTVSCPPAVPILYGGEKITAQAIETFTYYGITKIKVIKQQ